MSYNPAQGIEMSVERVRRFLAPPEFDDPEKTRQARLLNYISRAGLIVLPALLALHVAQGTSLLATPNAILIGLTLVIALMHVVMRRGHVDAAGLILVSITWAVLTFQGWAGDGVGDRAVNGQFIIIIAGGLLLGSRAAIVLTLFTIVNLWAMAYFETIGRLNPTTESPFTAAFDLTALLLLAGTIITLILTSLRTSVIQARKELTERLHADERLRRQAQYLTALHETTLNLISRLEVRPLLASILTRACELVDTPHGILELVLPDGSALRQELGYGALAPFNGKLTLKNEGATGRVWATGRSILVENYADWEGRSPEVVPLGFRAVMAVPLKLGETVTGALSVAHLEPDKIFTPEQQDLLERFAALASLAIENAGLHEQAQKELQDRRQTEKALRSSEARTRALLDAMPDTIFEISPAGVLLDFLPSSDLRLLKAPQEIPGRNISELFPREIVDQVMFAVSRALESGQLQAFEYGMPSGEETHFFEARVTASSSDSALVMVRDITQSKWVETEREKLIQELEDKHAELERFTYTVSHDLKSPLITIRGFLGFIEQDTAAGNTERLRVDIQRISDATDKMQRLLNELLELSRVGRLMNPMENIRFEELAREAVELVQGRIRASGARVRILKGMPVVYGNRQRLLEVLQNLVDNATKFMGAQSKPRIEIGQQGEQNGQPVLYVRDNGAGIPAQHHDRIFGLFNKLDIDSEGTGVGLALVKRIVEFHGGRIWVESEAGHGAAFFFTLPAASLEKPGLVPAVEGGRASRTHPATYTGG